MDTTVLLVFAGALFLNAGSPGPSVAMLVSQVVTRGAAAAIPFVAAMWIGEAAWLAAALASGYPVAMVGVQLAGNNMLPPTLALVGVMWLQVGAVLAFEPLARRILAGRAPARVIAVLGALGMPLYL